MVYMVILSSQGATIEYLQGLGAKINHMSIYTIVAHKVRMSLGDVKHLLANFKVN